MAVGMNDEIKAWTGAATQVIDLQGKTAIPGLIDSHAHITSTAMRMLGVVDLSEEAGVKSIADIQKKIADAHGYDIEDHSLVIYVRPRRKH